MSLRLQSQGAWIPPQKGALWKVLRGAPGHSAPSGVQACKQLPWSQTATSKAQSHFLPSPASPNDWSSSLRVLLQEGSPFPCSLLEAFPKAGKSGGKSHLFGAGFSSRDRTAPPAEVAIHVRMAASGVTALWGRKTAWLWTLLPGVVSDWPLKEYSIGGHLAMRIDD